MIELECLSCGKRFLGDINTSCPGCNSDMAAQAQVLYTAEDVVRQRFILADVTEMLTKKGEK